MVYTYDVLAELNRLLSPPPRVGGMKVWTPPQAFISPTRPPEWAKNPPLLLLPAHASRVRDEQNVLRDRSLTSRPVW